MAEPVTLWLCTSCREEGGNRDVDALGAALAERDFPVPVTVRAQGCMNACGNPLTLALSSAGRATYLFSGVQPAEDIDDIVSTLRLYLKSPAGWIVDARPCGRLRHCLVGRVPAVPATGTP